MRKDAMTGRERMIAALEFGETDRAAVFPLNYYQASRVLGITVGEYASSAERIAETAVAGAKFYGYDAVQIGTDVAVEGGACGSVIEQPDDSPAFVKIPAVQEDEDVERLCIPDVHKDVRMKRIIDATAICRERMGNEILICSNVMGPINLASQIRGVHALLMDSIIDPELFVRLVDFGMEVCLEYSKALIDAGADGIVFGEAICSPNMISPALYREHALPRQKKVFDELKAYGLKYPILHVCGDVTPILEDLSATGAVCLDIDSAVDMATAKQRSGCAVRGNLAPSALLAKGIERQVEAEAAEIIRTTYAGGGLILGTGCCAAPDTPHENILALVNASKNYPYE